jgi:HEAT repeat protein
LALILVFRGCSDDSAQGKVQFESPDALISQLTASDDAIAWQAATDLGRMRATVSLDALSECRRSDTRPKVRAAAALSLGRIDTWDAIPALLEAMNDDTRVVRAAADAAVIEMIGVDWQFDPDWPKDERQEWLAEFAKHIDKERGGWESWQKRRKNPYEPGAGTSE